MKHTTMFRILVAMLLLSALLMGCAQKQGEDTKPPETTEQTIQRLNFLREKYLKEDDERMKKFIWQGVLEMLPLSYNQKRTWSGNYQVLKRIYHARRGHKLAEWKSFLDFIETLPYAKELIIGEVE